jgi:hypothetical protein
MNPLLTKTLKEKGGLTYLASPYRGYAPDEPDDVFDDLLEEAAHRVAWASGELHDLRIPHFCPIVHGHWVSQIYDLDPRDDGLWMEHCEAHLRRCDSMTILMLEGWQTSSGVTREREIAEFLEYPIFQMAPSD